MSPEWKYKITIQNPDWHEIENWCLVYVGKFDQEWYKLGIDPAEFVIDGRTHTTWLFKKHEHATMFTLRWA